MDKRSFLAGHPLFKGLDVASQERLAAFARERPMQAGEVLFRRGDRESFMIAIVEGTVRVTIPSADGRERILAIFHPDDVLGEIALLDGKPRTADAIARSDGRLLVFERRDLLPVLRAVPDMTLALMELLCARLRRTSDQVEEQSFLDLATRLARALLRMADTDGHVVATQRDLAELVGATRESVNRRLREWEEAGLLRLGKGTIGIQDLRAMREAAAGGEPALV
jgi:CRP/FNR family cyclic AMP-dependent transcriptional regulator